MTSKDAIDISRLTHYLEQQIIGFKGPISLEKFEGGQSNPTYKVEAASGTYVLRRQPFGELLKSAHAVDREFRVIKALQDSDVPVPKVFHLCLDKTILGSIFYLMSHCDGHIHWDAALPEVQHNSDRRAMYDAMNLSLTKLHKVNIDALGLSDYGKPGNYFERQLSRWQSQYKASETNPITAMNTLITWLEKNLPDDDGKIALCHGDFRLDNLIFNPEDNRIQAILDWELSTLGHPYADLAYQCMQLRLPVNPEKNAISGLMGINATALGIPTEAEYVALYCQRMGIESIENWHFYLCFSFFRLAAIAQGVAKRALSGNASNKHANKIGAMVEPLALLALGIIENEQPSLPLTKSDKNTGALI
jgi:aminoglycoside phosphotransferase (APT) family kinase protein